MGKTPSDRKQAGGFAAPIVIDSAKSAEKLANAKRVGIFEIDGVTYDMPAAARAEVGLEYLDMLNAGDDDAASYYLITETLGLEAFNALKAVKGLDGEAFEGILVRVQAIILPKGKTPTASGTRG